MTEQTLILIKPDGVRRGLTGEILARIERKGYAISDLKLVHALPEQLHKHYRDHVEKSFYPGLVDYMTSGPMVAAVIEGRRVIEGVRSLCGDTDPTTAAPGTIRGDYGRDWGTEAVLNLVHSSDSAESAQWEKSVWFG
ncbi:MAG: nucleoside-diphosphate kinase [Actinomycetaceae bacterium]|nr:nucleoside-diphosphate kinase [Arcanobacterium sp.]MDD7686748.1 nucleoside-diphosphate kinase [Actinomycetaceae bacterium]MDY5272574.1 nucleoside-diphosphate kinase [Arcanobacterium sp.]